MTGRTGFYVQNIGADCFCLTTNLGKSTNRCWLMNFDKTMNSKTVFPVLHGSAFQHWLSHSLRIIWPTDLTLIGRQKFIPAAPRR
jgi:hypothetical protein